MALASLFLPASTGANVFTISNREVTLQYKTVIGLPQALQQHEYTATVPWWRPGYSSESYTFYHEVRGEIGGRFWFAGGGATFYVSESSGVDPSVQDSIAYSHGVFPSAQRNTSAAVAVTTSLNPGSSFVHIFQVLRPVTVRCLFKSQRFGDSGSVRLERAEGQSWMNLSRWHESRTGELAVYDSLAHLVPGAEYRMTSAVRADSRRFQDWGDFHYLHLGVINARGQVSWKPGFAGRLPAEVGAEVFDGANLVSTHGAVVRSDGFFAIWLPDSGSRLVKFRAAGTLRKAAIVDLSHGGIADLNIELIPGDTNGDNVVNETDFQDVFWRLGMERGDIHYYREYDFDGDEVIGPSDISVVLDNFGMVGD